MKFLLNENLPAKLRFDFAPEHEARTVQEMGWNGKKNGELLGLLTLYGFNALITVDRGLPHQQNLKRFPITIFLLLAQNNKHQTLQPLVEKVKQSIDRMKPQGIESKPTFLLPSVVEIS